MTDDLENKERRRLRMRFAKFSVLVIVLLFCCGCSVRLQPRVPTVEGCPGAGISVAAEEAAKGMPDPIGHGTFTLFAIKVASVTVKGGEGDKAVMNSIKETMKSGGYTVVDSDESEEGPVLEVKVRDFDFTNYTWGFPIVPTWGKIRLEMALVSKDGQTKWRQDYSGGSWNLWFSFSSAVNRSMAKVLTEFAEDMSKPEFRQACSS